MATINFILRKDKKKKDGSCLISLKYSIGDLTPYRPSTGKYIPAEYFNPDSESSPIRSSWYDAGQLNTFLRNRRARMNKIVDGYFMEHEEFPTPEYVKSLYDPPKERKGKFDDLFDLFLERQTRKNKGALTEETYKNNDKVRKRLHEYAEHKRTKMSFELITPKFASECSEYFIKEKNYLPNTLGSVFKVLRTFLNWTNKYHNTQINPMIIADLPVVDIEKQFPDLEITEIRAIAHYHLENELWARCRDAFIIQTCIGTRISDVSDIAAGKRIVKKGKGYIYEFTDKKTHNKLSVPLHPFVFDILEARLKEGTGWFPDENEINKNIKLICAAVGIDDKVMIEEMKDGQLVHKEVPKWSTITTHTARRSFINNMVRLRIPLHVIGSITGQSPRTLQRYLNASRQDKADAMKSFMKQVK